MGTYLWTTERPSSLKEVAYYLLFSKLRFRDEISSNAYKAGYYISPSFNTSLGGFLIM